MLPCHRRIHRFRWVSHLAAMIVSVIVLTGCGPTAQQAPPSNWHHGGIPKTGPQHCPGVAPEEPPISGECPPAP